MTQRCDECGSETISDRAYVEVLRCKAREEGSCCFCNRQIGADGTKHDAVVTRVRGVRGGISVRFCDACLRELLLASTVKK